MKAVIAIILLGICLVSAAPQSKRGCTQDSNCVNEAWLCTNAIFEEYYKANCQQTCGLCKRAEVAAPSKRACTETPGCAALPVSYCNDDSPGMAEVVTYMKSNCQATCGICREVGAGREQRAEQLVELLRDLLKSEGQ